MKTKVLTLVAALTAALGVAALASAQGSGKVVHSACFGVQTSGKSKAGISHGDVNVFAKHPRYCIVGRRGKAGPAGPQGPQGPKGDIGCTVRQIGVFYRPDVAFCPAGPQGPKGEKGDAGAVGPAGPAGPAGPVGAPGLGNGVIYACVSNGGTLQIDANGQPCDNQGHMPLKLVVVTP